MEPIEKPEFQDLKKRLWTIRLDAPLVRRVKDATGILLTDLRADPFLRLSTDPILLVDVLWLLCEKQAKDASVTEVDFGESLGDQVDEATGALVVAVANFCPSSRRSLLRSLLEKNERMQTEAMTIALQDLEASREDLTRAMAKRSMATMKRLLESIGEESSAGGASATSSTGSPP